MPRSCLAVRSSFLCPHEFGTLIPPLGSPSLPLFFDFICSFGCHEAFLSLMCSPASWKASAMSFHLNSFLFCFLWSTVPVSFSLHSLVISSTVQGLQLVAVLPACRPGRASLGHGFLPQRNMFSSASSYSFGAMEKWTAIFVPFCTLNPDGNDGFSVACVSEFFRFNLLSIVFTSRQKVRSTSKVPAISLPFRLRGPIHPCMSSTPAFVRPKKNSLGVCCRAKGYVKDVLTAMLITLLYIARMMHRSISRSLNWWATEYHSNPHCTIH